MTRLITLAGITKDYVLGAVVVPALKGVDLAIEKGEFTVLMGPSGSGKSTLLNILGLLDRPSAGSYKLEDREVGDVDFDDLAEVRNRRVGFIFQSFNLVPTLDISGNILLPFELDGRAPTGEERAWIDRLVAVLGLTDRLRHRPHELSGGQQQRVAIARALATRPDLVFADEPTGNLDSRTSREVLTLLQTASREYGQSIAMVTHDPVAASYADRIVLLNDGRVVDDRGRSSAEEISSIMLSMEALS